MKWSMARGLAAALVLLVPGAIRAQDREAVELPAEVHDAAAADPASSRVSFRLLPRKKSFGLFLVAQATVLIDMAQTLRIDNTPGLRESNPILGEDPSDEKILAFFGARIAFNAFSYYLLPDRWANVLSVLTIVVEVPVIAHNASLGLSVRF